MTDGGDGNNNIIFSEETRKLMSERRKGKKFPETSVRMKGENNPYFGKFGEDHPAFGRKDTPEQLQAKSERMSGEKHPLFGKKGEESP